MKNSIFAVYITEKSDRIVFFRENGTRKYHNPRLSTVERVDNCAYGFLKKKGNYGIMWERFSTRT